MSRFLLLLVAPMCFSCAETSMRPTRPAVPIKSACAAGSAPASSVGLDVRQGRRHSEARTIFVTNTSDRPRTVQVQQVARVEGACDGDWARRTPLDFMDEATCSAPRARTLQPGEQVHLQIGPQRALATWDCVKMGLSISMKVDGDFVCADAGAWIALRDGEE